MVLYICELCNKEFNKKYNYTMHINRKKICISDSQIIETILKLKEDNINTNLELEKIKKLEDNTKLKENIKKLEDKIKEFKKDKDTLKEENFTMKVQMKEKQDLLNYKDIEIKDLYKNMNIKKNINNDIKIKLVQEYVYIIRECDFVRLNEDIYKIGRTSKTNPEDRFQKYRSKANYENLYKFS
jgi:predicted nuclease with TOPRIM domain